MNDHVHPIFADILKTFAPIKSAAVPVLARECIDQMCACRGGPCAECPEGEAISRAELANQQGGGAE